MADDKDVSLMSGPMRDAVQPAAWCRGTISNGPEIAYGVAPPPGNGWTPLYRDSLAQYGWQPFDPAKMQHLGFYVVEFSDTSVGMDTWEDGDWQQIDPDNKIAFVFQVPERLGVPR